MNRNTLFFMVGTLGLFGLYWLAMTKWFPPPARTNPEPAQVAPAPTPVPAPTPAPASQLPSSPMPQEDRTFKVETNTLSITWRVADGAITQVLWKKDGTPFLPVPAPNKSKPFPGVGGVLNTTFQSDPQVLQEVGAKTVVFTSQAGERLTYRLPDQGHVVDVHWQSTQGAHMALLRMPTDIQQVEGLGRVFTLQDKSIQSVKWAGMLKDPFFSFLGSKRDVLPGETSRLGMDAGMSPKGEPTGTQFFAIIWELGRTPERDMTANPGYHLAPDQDGQLSARLFLGPKQAEALESFGKPYSQVLDFGFFGVIAKVLFWVLRSMQRFIPNWGWTLVVFSILIRLALWTLNTKSTVQMLRMKDFEPHQKAIQAKYEKYGNDMTKKAEMQKELMALYKKNGHNPMGGCWPMLIQMPVFLALFSMMSNVFELRGAPWFGWIKDLSAPDPTMIMPILLGVTMFVQSKMTPSVGDETQKKMMTWLMPIMMIIFFRLTPSGLCLYYLVYNLVHIFHTWLLLRSYKPQPVVL